MYFKIADLSVLRPGQGSGKADLRPNLGGGLLHSKKAFM